jgi:adenosylhomocysteine nucleosidase
MSVEQAELSSSGFESDLLICFAVKHELGKRIKSSGIPVLITGMGQRNAEASLNGYLEHKRPAAVFTCGFAGGLNPAHKRGDVLFAHDPEINIAEGLASKNARAARFRLSPQIIATAEEKAMLYALTGADAVEMESVAIRAICKKRGIPSATVRVVLDEAGENLPVDFNRILTRGMSINYPKLMLMILRHPGLIRGLLQMQRNSAEAAERLDETLAGLLGHGNRI